MTHVPALQEAQGEAEWLTRSLPSLRHDQAARDMASTVVARLTVPADTAWTMARIAALLSPYYDRDIPQAVRIMEAEDWAEALAEYPQWAVQNAVRWWKSEHNPDRRKRPMEGDIAARCRKEMDAVRAAEIYLRQPTIAQAEERPPVSPEDAAERKAAADRIMAEVFHRKNLNEAAE